MRRKRRRVIVRRCGRVLHQVDLCSTRGFFFYLVPFELLIFAPLVDFKSPFFFNLLGYHKSRYSTRFVPSESISSALLHRHCNFVSHAESSHTLFVIALSLQTTLAAHSFPRQAISHSLVASVCSLSYFVCHTSPFFFSSVSVLFISPIAPKQQKIFSPHFARYSISRRVRVSTLVSTIRSKASTRHDKASSTPHEARPRRSARHVSRISLRLRGLWWHSVRL